MQKNKQTNKQNKHTNENKTKQEKKQLLNDPYCKKIKRIRIKYEHIRIVTHNLLLHMENQESKMRSKRLTICQIRIVDYRTYVCLAIQWRHEFELRDGLQYSVFSCRLPNATKFSI